MGGAGGVVVVGAAGLSMAAVGAAMAGRRAAARALLGFAAALGALALALFGAALWRVDTSLAEVAATTSRSTAAPLRLAALWAGPASSLLCFATLTAVMAAAWARRLRARGLVAVAAPVAVLLVVAALARPFRTAALAPLDGTGLVPVLRRTSMLVHPPVLYAGLALTLMAAAIGVADLAGQADDAQRRLGRRTALVAWSLLAVGMVLGSRWAHREVGWGGVWAWDPVEDAALLPWLALTGGIHRRSPRGWWAGAGLLAWAGTWATRSGRLGSVHAFSGQGAVGAGLGLALVAFAAGVAVVAAVGHGRLRSCSLRRPSPLGLLVGGAAAWVGVGTAWAALGGGNRTVADSFYTSLVGPLAIAVLAVLARGASRAEVAAATLAGTGVAATLALAGWRSPGIIAVAVVGPAAVVGAVRRPGGRGALLAHLGLVLLVAGAVATTTGRAGTVRLAVDDQRRVAGLDIRLVGLAEVSGRDRHGVAAQLVVGGRRLTPALVEVEQLGPRADVATASGLTREVQAALVSTDGQGTAVVSVSTTPGATWVWGGGLLLAAGGLVEVTTRRGGRRERPALPQPELERPRA